MLCVVTLAKIYIVFVAVWNYAQFNSNKSPTRCNNFPVYYPDVYLQLNTLSCK